MGKSKITATFAILLLTTTIIASLLPQATATPIIVTSVAPEEGYVGKYVGDIMRVIGEIDTQNGSYKIFFDEEEVKNGTAIGTAVSDIFIVPHRPRGNYTVKLHDVAGNTSDTATFTLETAYYIEAVVPTQPEQLQEGEITEIWVNVTGGAENTRYRANITVIDPSDAIYYNDTLLLTNTTNTGNGKGSAIYPTHFGSSAHTNYTGMYNIAFNGTLKTGNFTIGLTNATEYHRFQVVDIRAANYTQLNEWAWVNITFGNRTVFSENVSAVNSLIKASWEIPDNASMGLYNVTVTNSTSPGTVKSVSDTQNFTIVKIPFQVRAKKLDGKVLADVKVDVYNATKEWVGSDKTDDEGLARFSVEGGNYTVEASWAIEAAKYVLIGTLSNQSIKGNVTLNLTCWITHLRMVVSPALPFINVTLTYHNITRSFETNSTGIIKAYYMLTNISYTVEARRYGFLFFNTTMEKLPVTMNMSWVNITILLPTYTLFVHVVDSKSTPLPNLQVSLTEWSSLTLIASNNTDDNGNASFSATFGRYKINVYNYSAVLEREVVLNETTIDLVKNEMSIDIQCSIFNVSLYVEALDYFGQPIPNALVEVERKFGQEWVKIENGTTGLDGFARFVPLRGLVGGDCRISVYVAGKLNGIEHLYLDGSKQILFKIGKYTVIAGYPVETSQLIVYISIGLLVVVFVLALTYRRLLRRFVKKKEVS
ncbi:MAG: hypothetical protein JSV12_07560 [Candidatus Bathyarchaeota archaeon]|nr:MAG: hypothetical protein JSV12_07560 [Candidatus Bathyarchaeota archaeon]